MKSLSFYENNYQQRLMESLGIDEKKMRSMVTSDKFSIHKLRQSIFHEAYHGRLKENAETTFGQFLRAGVQTLAADYFNYSAAKTVYQDIVDIRTSNKAAEFYAPMYGIEIPREIGVDGKYAESRMHATDSMMVNRKFGRLYKFQQELWDDDQTGEIRRKAAQMGEGMRILQELYFVARLSAEKMTFPEGVTVRAPQLLGANVYKDDLWGTVGGIKYGNRPTANNVMLTAKAIEDAHISFMNARDPHGRRILVEPSVLIVSGQDSFNAARLLNSTLHPSVPSVSNQGTDAAQFTGGATGWTMATNPLKGLYSLKISRYLPAYYWFIGEPKKGLILQEREPMSVVQENPLSGESFSRDMYVFRVKARWEMDWIVGANNFWYKGYCKA